MKPGNGRSESCGRKAKRRGDTLHTAHDAPLEIPDRPERSPYTCMLPEHSRCDAGARCSTCSRWRSGSLSRRRYGRCRTRHDRPLFERMRSSSSALTRQAVSTPRGPVPNERRRRLPPHDRWTGTTGEWPPAARRPPPAPARDGPGRGPSFSAACSAWCSRWVDERLGPGLRWVMVAPLMRRTPYISIRLVTSGWDSRSRVLIRFGSIETGRL